MIARRLAAMSVCVLAFAATGCGVEASTNKADTEGVWVDAGKLDYHIQGSRQLNPSQVPDDRYLEGVPSSEPQPSGRETWFAVFMRIENKSGTTALTAEDFEIEDTEGKVYRPVELDTKVNAFAYKPINLESSGVVPHPDSTQEFSSTSGAMLLFKLPLTTIANRPLEFKITAPPGEGEPASATVDVGRLERGFQDGLRSGRRGGAARALADQQHRHHDARLPCGGEGDEPGVRVRRVVGVDGLRVGVRRIRRDGVAQLRRPRLPGHGHARDGRRRRPCRP